MPSRNHSNGLVTRLGLVIPAVRSASIKLMNGP